LVHLYLAGEDPELQLGGLMGDFVKGPLPASCPERLATGLHLHRRIDSLSQASRHTRRSRQRLRSHFGHARGIIVDIFYDHFLATNWTDFAAEPLENFAAEVYRLLQGNHDRLPPAMQQVATRMIEHDWLVSYRQPEVVGRALQRIAERLSRPLPLADAVEDLERHDISLRCDFNRFMIEAGAFVEKEFDVVVGRTIDQD